MQYHEHQAGNDAAAHALKLCRKHKKEVGIYLLPNNKLSVRFCAEKNGYTEEPIETVAIFSVWDDSTIQLREEGAQSTFIKI